MPETPRPQPEQPIDEIMRQFDELIEDHGRALGGGVNPEPEQEAPQTVETTAPEGVILPEMDEDLRATTSAPAAPPAGVILPDIEDVVFPDEPIDVPEPASAPVPEVVVVPEAEVEEAMTFRKANNLLRQAWRERQEEKKQAESRGFLKVSGVIDSGKLPQRLFPELRDRARRGNNLELKRLVERAGKEADARESLHNASLGHKENMGNLDNLLVSMGLADLQEGRTPPDIKTSELDVNSLEALAKGDENVEGDGKLGEHIAMAMRVYMRIGEEHFRLYGEMLAAKEAHGLGFDETQWWIDNDRREVRNNNIFTAKLGTAQMAEMRERIGDGITRAREVGISNEEKTDRRENGADAVKLAEDLLIAFGYGAKYSLGRNSMTDSLAELMRPNAAIQGQRRSSGAEGKRPAPESTLGVEGDMKTQDLRHLRLLLTFPEQMDLNGGINLTLLDGSRMSLHKALVEGKFYQVDWKNFPELNYSAWRLGIGKAKRLYDALKDTGVKNGSVGSSEKLKDFRKTVVQVLSRAYPGVEGNGTADEKAKFIVRVDQLLYAWAKGVIAQHNPKEGVAQEDQWKVDELIAMREAMKKATKENGFFDSNKAMEWIRGLTFESVLGEGDWDNALGRLDTK